MNPKSCIRNLACSIAVSVASAVFITSCADKEKSDVSVNGISVEPSEIELSAGQSVKLAVSFYPENASNTSVMWFSGDDDVVTVDADGTVHAVAAGNAVVTAIAEDGGYEAGCEVNVINTGTYQGKLVRIDAGTFMMGSPADEPGRYDNETLHEVTLTEDFYMTACEITNAEYAAFANSAGITQRAEGEITYVNLATGEEVTEIQKFFYDTMGEALEYARWGLTWNGTEWTPMEGYEDYPMVFVTWYGALAYAHWVGGTLPTEAQWEYACRAGTDTVFPFGDDPTHLGDYAWYEDNSDGHTHPVGQKEPNAWGLYDMIGNVWEWCYDYMSDYPDYPVTDPVGTVPDDYETCVLRGASYVFSPVITRSAMRFSHSAWRSFEQVGFRVVFVQ